MLRTPFIKKVYLNGPVVLHGFDSATDSSCRGKIELNVGFYLIGYIILFLPLTFLFTAMSDKKSRKRLLASLCVVMVFSLTSISQMIPSAQALNVSTSAIRATDVWATGNRGAGINVAVIDTGIDLTHNDFANAIVDQINIPDMTGNVQDSEGHGTHVVGIVAGRGVNNSNYRGVAWDAGLVIVRIRSDGDLEPAVRWIINHRTQDNIRVIQSSVAPAGVGRGGDGLDSPYSIALDDAVEDGIVVVQSAGNDGNLGSSTISSPGNAFNVITVGAINDLETSSVGDDELAYYPNEYTYKGNSYVPWGSGKGPTSDGRPKPDVVAPGVHIWSTKSSAAPTGNFEDVTQNGYGEASGTSQAAPHVSGTVALILHANPNLTPAQVKAILRQTAKNNTNLNELMINDRGYGIIDAYDAVQWAQNVGNIQISQMYDSYDVITPTRNLGGGENDYLTFTVDAPSSEYGIALSDVRYWHDRPFPWADWDYDLIHKLSAQHVWIDGAYYNLAADMNRYLLCGPRISSKGAGFVGIEYLYKINDEVVQYRLNLFVDQIYVWVDHLTGSSLKTLIYIDAQIHDATNFPYLPSTSETVFNERKVTGDIIVNVRDINHIDYVQVDPFPEDNSVMWILRSGYTGNNPDTALNNEYTCDQDIAIYYQGTQETWGHSGALINRITDVFPPMASQPSGITHGLTSGTYPYSSVIADPEGDLVYYKFSWGNTESEWSQNPVYSGTTVTGYHQWTSPSTYDVTVYVKDQQGQESASQPLTVSIGQPGYGCPYVSVWNGIQYVLDNNVLPAAEVSNGTDVEDSYKLEQTLVPNREGRLFSIYSLKLSEFEHEHSYIDQVRLLAVDHNSDVNIAVTPDGEILTYRNPWTPISAVDNYGNNRLNEISQIDGNISDPTTYYYGVPNDYLILNFGQINSDNAKLILRDDMIKKDECIEVQVKDNDGVWQTVDTVFPRAYWSIEAVNLSSYIVDGQDFWVRLYWKNPHRLDFVGLDTTQQEDYELSTATLVSAVHSTQGNVKQQLLTNDNIYAQLIPDQQIFLAFRLPNNSNQARTYIFYTEGHYFKIE